MTVLRKNKFKREFLFIAIVFFLFLVLSPFLLRESPFKTFVIFLSLLSWLGLFLYTKNIIFSSLLYIFLVLPFNITLQLPLSVEILNTEVFLANPFVEGIYVNYLVPTLSILDLGIFLSLVSILIIKGLSFYIEILKNIRNGLLIFLVFLAIQNIILFNMNSLLFSLRFFCLIVLFFSCLKVVKKGSTNFQKKRIINTGILIFLINISIQGFLGVLQFKRGSSLGIGFLGESEIVSGMMGSSFVELAGQLFLRAYGTFPHPNVLAGFLLLSLFLGIYRYHSKKGQGALLIGISLLSMLFTFSRVTILLAVFVLVVFLVQEIFLRKEKKLLSISVSPLLLMERFQNLFGNGDSSWSERLDLVKASFKVIKENWLLGVGGGNFVEGIEGFVPRTSRGLLLTQPVHNIFLLSLAEFGIMGTLMIGYILFYLLFNNAKKFSLYGFLPFLSLFIVGLFDHYLFSLPQGMVIFAIFLFIGLYSLQGKVKV